ADLPRRKELSPQTLSGCSAWQFLELAVIVLLAVEKNNRVDCRFSGRMFHGQRGDRNFNRRLSFHSWSQGAACELGEKIARRGTESRSMAMPDHARDRGAVDQVACVVRSVGPSGASAGVCQR